MLGRRLLGGFIGAGALLGATPTAPAQVTVERCEARALRGAECGTVAVPLNHAAPPPSGRAIRLAFVRLRAQRARRGTVVYLAGGPGQAATSIAGQAARGELRGLRRRYDLVFVDQRGSGASTPLRCSVAPRGVFDIDADASPAAAAAVIRRCADELGDDRRFFSTYETVLDLEDLRAFLRVPKIIPMGTSYGGQIAGEYARRFPDRVAAMVLDSTSPIEGVDALGRLPQLALPRVLREVCFPPGCGRILDDPPALLAAAVARLARGPLTGRLVLPSGRRRTASVTLLDLYSLVTGSDQDPAMRTALPAALDAARRGDAAPLLRLGQRAGGGGGASSLNEIRFLATACTEGRLPWDPQSDPATRPALLEAALRENAGAYAPFPVEVVAPQVTASLCLGWSPTPRAPFTPAPASGPAVPVLVLAGREDLRTPLEDQRRAAAQFPRARVLAVPNVGHSVLATDTSGCAVAAVQLFLAGQRFGTCRRAARDVPLALPVFRDLAELPRPAGRTPALVGRTAVAVDVTLRDVARQIAGVAVGSVAGDVRSGAVRIGGLRGGRLLLGRRTIVLQGYEVVPGVRLTGRLSLRGVGTLAVTGAGADGTVRVRRSGAFTGRLGGVTISYRPRPLG